MGGEGRGPPTDSIYFIHGLLLLYFEIFELLYRKLTEIKSQNSESKSFLWRFENIQKLNLFQIFLNKLKLKKWVKEVAEV